MSEVSQKPQSAKNPGGSSSTTSPTPSTSSGSSAAPSQKSSSSAHFVLQGKGGVGKTFVASLLAQYLARNGEPVTCIDTDPVNASLNEIQGLEVEVFKLFKPESDEVDFRSLDSLISRLVETPGTYVIDNGASSFKPMSTYLLEQGILQTLTENGVSVTLHLVVATGPELAQTIAGAESLIEALPAGSGATVMVWLNEHRGPFESFTDGTSLTESRFYLNNRTKIRGVITIPHQSRAAAENVAVLLASKKTFDEAMKSPDFFIVEKSRLRAFRTTIFDAIEQARI